MLASTIAAYVRHTAVGVSTHGAFGDVHTLQAFPLLHQLYGGFQLQVDGPVLQGSPLNQQADLSQNTGQTGLHSAGPDLAQQHAAGFQQSARVAMVCLMHQLAVPLTSKDVSVGSQQQQMAAQHDAAAGSNTVVPGWQEQ